MDGLLRFQLQNSPATFAGTKEHYHDSSFGHPRRKVTGLRVRIIHIERAVPGQVPQSSDPHIAGGTVNEVHVNAFPMSNHRKVHHVLVHAVPFPVELRTLMFIGLVGRTGRRRATWRRPSGAPRWGFARSCCPSNPTTGRFCCCRRGIVHPNVKAVTGVEPAYRWSHPRLRSETDAWSASRHGRPPGCRRHWRATGFSAPADLFPFFMDARRANQQVWLLLEVLLQRNHPFAARRVRVARPVRYAVAELPEIRCVEIPEHAPLPQVGDALDSVRLLFGPRQRRQEQGCQDGDDGDDDQQLDQGESPARA